MSANYLSNLTYERAESDKFRDQLRLLIFQYLNDRNVDDRRVSASQYAADLWRFYDQDRLAWNERHVTLKKFTSFNNAVSTLYSGKNVRKTVEYGFICLVYAHLSRHFLEADIKSAARALVDEVFENQASKPTGEAAAGAIAVPLYFPQGDENQRWLDIYGGHWITIRPNDYREFGEGLNVSVIAISDDAGKYNPYFTLYTRSAEYIRYQVENTAESQGNVFMVGKNAYLVSRDESGRSFLRFGVFQFDYDLDRKRSGNGAFFEREARSLTVNLYGDYINCKLLMMKLHQKIEPSEIWRKCGVFASWRSLFDELAFDWDEALVKRLDLMLAD